MAKHKETHQQDEGRGFLSGLFYGVLVGGALALFMAPRSGVEMRHKLKEQSLRLREQVEQTANEALAKAEELQHTGREYLEDTRHRLERTAEAVVKSAQEAWQEDDVQRVEFPEPITHDIEMTTRH
jgi:gas vesicle protein